MNGDNIDTLRFQSNTLEQGMAFWIPNDIEQLRTIRLREGGIDEGVIRLMGPNRRFHQAYDNTPLQALDQFDPADFEESDGAEEDDGVDYEDSSEDTFHSRPRTRANTASVGQPSEDFEDHDEDEDSMDGQPHGRNIARYVFDREAQDQLDQLRRPRLIPQHRDMNEINDRLDNALARILADPNAEIEVININPEVLFGRPN